MKSFQRIIFLLFLSAMAFGCSPESVGPESGEKNVLGSYIPLPRPQVQCGPSIFTRMKDGQMDLGGVEILNNSTHTYIILNMNQYKFVEEIKVFQGNVNNLPMDNDGNILVENFSCQNLLNVPANIYTLMLPLSTTPSCSDYVVWARISTRSIFGNLVATNYAWMAGSPISNGYSVNYCAPSCSSGATTLDNVN
jgi:hypothetical protein